MKFEHKSVLLEESIVGLNIKKDKVYVDGTMGGAGHSKVIESKIDTGKLICIDQDIDAINNSKDILDLNKSIVVNDNFNNIDKILKELEIPKISGILLDLGVSSYQLDNKKRGFSYMKDDLLDMRMDKNSDLTADYVVNNYSEEELFRIIKEYGEEKWAKRIAKFIIEERKLSHIKTTLELVEIINKAIPKGARAKGSHPAKRTFQAIRIEVNNELDIISSTIKKVLPFLEEGGRIVIITFHSLEDRIVKKTFNDLALNCICPPEFPVCNCSKKSEIKIINKKPILPSKEELENNSRSKSAKLRIAEKI